MFWSLDKPPKPFRCLCFWVRVCFFSSIFATSQKLTWHWKIHHLKMYFLLKTGTFQCHVSFQRCMFFFGCFLGWPCYSSWVCLKPRKFSPSELRSSAFAAKTRLPPAACGCSSESCASQRRAMQETVLGEERDDSVSPFLVVFLEGIEAVVFKQTWCCMTTCQAFSSSFFGGKDEMMMRF